MNRSPRAASRGRALPWLLLVLALAAAIAIGLKLRRAPAPASVPTRTPIPAASIVVTPVVEAGLFGLGGGHVASDGSLWLWGAAADVVAPAGMPSTAPVARRANGVSGVVGIAIGECYILALLRDGSVRSTGCNSQGQLGSSAVADRQSSARDTWLEVDGLRDVAQVVAGRSVAYAVKADGSVWAWGSNDAHALGTAVMVDHSATPLQLTALTGVKSLVVDGYRNQSETHHAVKTDGSVWMWGHYYDLALPYEPDRAGWREYITVDDPMRVPGLSGVVALADHPIAKPEGGRMVALHDDGSASLWGGSVGGPCNDAASREALTLPLHLRGLSHLASVATGAGTVIGVGRDGSVWRWADRAVDQDVPVQGCMDSAERLLPAGSALMVSASHGALILLMADRSVLVWGLDVSLDARSRRETIRWADRRSVQGLPR